MEEYGIPLLLSMVTTLLNYIFINSISNMNQKQTVQDLKSVLDYIRTDTLNEIKETQDMLEKVVAAQTDILKESVEKNTKETKVISNGNK